MWSGGGAALISGGMDLLQSGINAYANHREAALNRDFQERMFKNRYQYTVADLKAAGLNPALAYGGLASSSPSGSQATGNPADMSNTGKSLAQLQENAIKKQTEIAETQAEVNAATADKIKAETKVLETDADYREAEKWLESVGKAAAGVGVGIGVKKWIDNKIEQSTGAKTVYGFAQAREQNPIPDRLKSALSSGGKTAAKASAAILRAGGPALLLEAISQSFSGAFSRERRIALEDKEREKQGKKHKSTFNIDRHF